MDKCWPAHLTRSPKVVDLSRVRYPNDPFRFFDLSSEEPITLNLNDRSYRLPPHTRYVRYGLSQEGLMVEYQDADGDWRGADEQPPSGASAGVGEVE